MTREEMLDRCKKTKEISQDDVWAVSPIYCLLDFDKDDFCKLVDAIGLEKWVAAEERWNRLEKAYEEFTAKERYLKEKARREELSLELQQTNQFIRKYEEQQADFIGLNDGLQEDDE